MNILDSINLAAFKTAMYLDEPTTTLDDELKSFTDRFSSLIDSFWKYIIIALAAVVVVWGAYIGIRIAIAHKNEEKINARDMVKNLIIGILVIFLVAVGAPLLIAGLEAWAA